MIDGTRRASGHLAGRLEETWVEVGEEWERFETKTKIGLMTDRD